MHSAGVVTTDEDGAETVPARAMLDELRLDPRAWARASRETLVHDLMLREAARLGFQAPPEETREAAKEFRQERGLQTEKKFERWLEKHQLSRVRLDELMRERALLRRARPRLTQRAELRLLDHLRLSGQYECLLARARDKARVLERFGAHGPRLEEAGVSADALLERYLKSLGRPTEGNLEDYSAAVRLLIEDSDALVQTLLREHTYLSLQNRRQQKDSGETRKRQAGKFRRRSRS
jgi:hypothetical protein